MAELLDTRDGVVVSAASLQEEWQRNMERVKWVSPVDFTAEFLDTLSYGPTEVEFRVVNLEPFRLLRRRTFRKHIFNARIYLWQLAVSQTRPKRAREIKQRFRSLLLTSLNNSQPRFDAITSELTLLDSLLDNLSEEGFLSMAHYITQRVWGDLEKNPGLLPRSIRLGMWLDEIYQDYVERAECLRP
ncbi:MAG: hypothetical protein HQL52_14080 [Magnetococcales bacterium]|nr:hypothetical protein [Magnetococcales bacterium]